MPSSDSSDLLDVLSPFREHVVVSEESAQFTVRLSDGQEFGPATVEMIRQWALEGRVTKDALLIPADGGEAKSVFAEPALAAVLSAPPTVAAALPQQAETDATGGLIPYKNPPALIGYYVSVFSLIPCLGLLLGPIAIVLGIIGLRKKAQHPNVRGTAHALVAIILGALTTVGNIVGIVMIIPAALNP